MTDCRFEKHAGTVAILAQGTSWAVADMQALFTFLEFKIDPTSETSRSGFCRRQKRPRSPKKVFCAHVSHHGTLLTLGAAYRDALLTCIFMLVRDRSMLDLVLKK